MLPTDSSSARPVDGDVLRSAAPEFDAADLAGVLAKHWGREVAHWQPLDSERDRNVLLDGAYVLKVSNPAEAAAVVDMEVAAVKHLAAVDPDLAVPHMVPAPDGRDMVELTDRSGRRCLVRLLTVVPGERLEGKPITLDVAERIGNLTARTELGLRGFFHPAADRRIGWDIRRIDEVAAGVAAAADEPWYPLVDRVRPALVATRSLPSWIQHADVTLTNILADGEGRLGVVDFGDMHHTAAACDLAVAVTSVMRNTAPQQESDPWELVGAVIGGYQRRRLLEPDEVDVLGELILARLLVTAAISRARAGAHPDNRDYITQYDASNDRILDLVASRSPHELRRRLATIAGTRRAPRPGGGPEPAVDPGGGLLQRRQRVMGGALSPLFYARPLDIVAGQGPWLYARDGARYLDGYNNVAVVGHAHPAITQAVTRQLSVLNTHSRYLHEGVVELAERIAATMPQRLDTCLFTTSGTEANELAWRLATEFTGGTGAVVVERAYHGSSRWMTDISPSEWPPGYRPARVATFPGPRALTEEDAEEVAVQRIRVAADVLAGAGDTPALVLVDTLFTSEGVLDPPAGFFRGLLAGAHAEGALFLADEVQAGYGRTGPRLWRFARAGIVPDIVTLGKPMGAGYPIGAVVTTREIADSLGRRYEYFSTFAATPVAAAAGNAVLDVLATEELPASAERVGTHLRARLTELAATHPVLGDVRGVGLVAGVDLSPSRHEAAPGDRRAFAKTVLEGLVNHRVLAGLTGPDGATLKVRPPLVWRERHVDVFIDALDRVLGQTPEPDPVR
jgi:4-aminobutyrate aminotransferase-like enzyme/Ser/Thr protein kinase RdoA (MazF antagonist)